jgi:hypothetical protein
MISKLFKREAKPIIPPTSVKVFLNNRYGAVDRIQNYNRGYSIAARFDPMPKASLDERMYYLSLQETNYVS